MLNFLESLKLESHFQLFSERLHFTVEALLLYSDDDIKEICRNAGVPSLDMFALINGIHKTKSTHGMVAMVRSPIKVHSVNVHFVFLTVCYGLFV